MSRIKSPHAKKQLAYDRDHVDAFEYPKASRKNWPQKEARTQRAQRKAVHTRLTAATGVSAQEMPEVEVGDIPRKKVRKPRPATLREAVARKKAKRVALAGRKTKKRRPSS